MTILILLNLNVRAPLTRFQKTDIFVKDLHGNFSGFKEAPYSSVDQYVNYPTQPHDQNKTKIDQAFCKKKAISERFLMEKSVE